MVFRILKKLKKRLVPGPTRSGGAGSRRNDYLKEFENETIELSINKEERELSEKLDDKYPYPKKGFESLSEEEKKKLTEKELQYLER